MPTVRLQNPTGSSTPLAGPAKAIPGRGPMQGYAPRESFASIPVGGQETNQAVKRLGAAVTQLSVGMQRFQNRVDTTAAESKLTEFNRAKNDMFFNPKTGYMNTRGQNAYEAGPQFTEQLQQLQKTYLEELGTTEAQNLFKRASDSVLTRSQADIMRHSSREYSAWEAASVNAVIEETLEEAVLYWNNPDQRAIAMERGRQSVMDSSVSSGSSAEATQENLQNFNSKFASNVVEAALSENSASGQKALADMRTLLEPQDVVQLQDKIDRQTRIDIDREHSDAAVIIATGMVEEYGDQDNARQQIREQVSLIEDPSLREKALRESMYQLGVKLTGDNERRANSFDAVKEYMIEGGSVDQWITENPSAWEDLTADQKAAALKPVATVTNFEVYSELMLLPPGDLAQIDPNDYAHVLSTADRQKLLTAVKGARTGSPESQIGRTRSAQVTESVDHLFGAKADRNDEERDQANQFYSMLTAEEYAMRQHLGRDLTSQEFTDLLANFTRTTTIQRRHWLDTSMNLSDVPAPNQSSIVDFLRANNKAVTAENIIRAYRDGTR